MARSTLTSIGQDLVDDSGSVLFSFIKGEQLEYPITLEFAQNVLTGYTFEAVVVEALNEAGQTTAPTAIKPSGVQTVLTVRVPTYEGTWDAPTAYNMEEIVLYAGKYWKLKSGVAVVNATPPDASPLWEETTTNKIYVQFASTLAATWAVQPAVGSPSYGFFELRVQEPNNSIFQRTWKPVRGMVQVLFSPTDVVP